MTNNTPDPDVAAWMESIEFRYVPNRFDHGKHFVNDDMGGQIDEWQAAFFYHAQQRAVLEGRIDGLNLAWQEVAGVTEGKPNRVMKCLQVIENAKTELEAQLQNNKEGKL